MKFKDYIHVTYKKGEWVQEVPYGPYGKKGKGRIIEVDDSTIKVKYLYDINIYEYKLNEVIKDEKTKI